MILAFLLAQSVVPTGVPVMVDRAGPWDPMVITLIGGQIVLILGAIVSGVLQIITHMRVTAVKEQQVAASTRMDTVAKDTEAIKGHVNSEKTAAQGREAKLAAENMLLREMLTDKKQTAALLAQAAVRPVPADAARPVRRTDEAAPPLKVEVVNAPESPIPVDPVHAGATFPPEKELP